MTAVTTYDIVDNTTSNSLLTGVASGAGPYTRTYTDGASISLKSQGAEPAFDFGAQTTIKGQPATGDAFTLKASTNVDVFKTLNDLISAVQNASRTATGNTKLANDLNVALSNIDNSLDNVVRVRASVGARAQEVDTAKSAGADLVLQYTKTLSGLRDLDLAKAISDLTLQQLTVDAASCAAILRQGARAIAVQLPLDGPGAAWGRQCVELSGGLSPRIPAKLYRRLFGTVEVNINFDPNPQPQKTPDNV